MRKPRAAIILELYNEYIDELALYDPSLIDMTQKERAETAMAYDLGLHEIWIDIIHAGQLVGFIAIGLPGSDDCHPDADYTICQAYIRPDHRRKGLTSKAIMSFVEEHPGVYALDVIKGNDGAQRFWDKVFLEYLQAEKFEIAECRRYEICWNLNLQGYRVRGF